MMNTLLLLSGGSIQGIGAITLRGPVILQVWSEPSLRGKGGTCKHTTPEVAKARSGYTKICQVYSHKTGISRHGSH